MDFSLVSKTLVQLPISVQPKGEARIVDLSIMDQVQPPVHFPILFLFAASNKPWDLDHLKSSLVEALQIFYPLVGRFKVRMDESLEVECSNKGMLLVSASVKGRLQDLTADWNTNSKSFFDLLHPAKSPSELMAQIEPPKMSEIPVLMIQITTFECGGVALSAALHHMFGDMSSLMLFMKAWAEISSTGQTSRIPTFEKSALQPRSPPTSKFSHIEYKNITQFIPSSPPPQLPSLSTKTINFTLQIFEELRSKAPKFEYTRFELMLAHLWRCITQARGTHPENQVKLEIVVDGRKRLIPNLPENYFGNVIFLANAIANAGELLSAEFSFACEEIHRAIKRMDDKYLRSAMDWIAVQQDRRSIRPNSNVNLGHDLAVSSWLRHGAYDIDFGWGKPVYGGTVPSLGFDGMIWVEPISKEDEICCSITLVSQTMRNFLPLIASNSF